MCLCYSLVSEEGSKILGLILRAWFKTIVTFYVKMVVTVVLQQVLKMIMHSFHVFGIKMNPEIIVFCFRKRRSDNLQYDDV